MVDSDSRDISTEIRNVLGDYFHTDHHLDELKYILRDYEKVLPFSSLSWSDTPENKRLAINAFITYFFEQHFLQEADVFLNGIDDLRQELNEGEDLHSRFNACLDNLKRRFILTKLETLYREQDDFHILISGFAIEANGATDLANSLLKYLLIVGQMLEHLSLTKHLSVNDRNEPLHKIDIDRWYRAVTEGFSILETCSRTGEDFEHLLFHIKEVFGISNDWKAFYRKVCEIVKKNITATPLQKLRPIIEQANFPEETLREAYSYSLSNFSPSGATLTSLLQNLASAKPTPSSIPIVKFVAYLSYQAGEQRKMRMQEALKNWNEEAIQLFDLDNNWLDSLPGEVKVEAERKVFLLIVVKSDDAQTYAKPRKEQMFTVRAWLVDDENDKIGSDYQSEKAVPFSNVPQCIDEIRTQFTDYLGRIKEVDLFFQNQLLFRTIDSWKIDTGLERVQFIKELAWVVRSLERAERYKYIKHKWVPLWDHFQEINGDIKEIFRAYKEDECRDREKLRDNISSHTDFCIALSFLPSASHHKPIFTTMLNEGVPIILWYERERKSMPDNFPAWLEELLVKNGSRDITKIMELPTLIRDARHTRPDESKHLMLLWDNPYRLPPIAND